MYSKLVQMQDIVSLLLNYTTYTVEGFGEAPGTLWVWAPGLREISVFWCWLPAKSATSTRKACFLAGLQPSKPPRAGDRVSRVN